MAPLLPTALAALTLTASTLALPLETRQAPTCVSGLYILVARGSDEAIGEGKTMAVSDLIEASVPNSVSVAVDYPAAIIGNGDGVVMLDDIYPTSVAAGVDDLVERIEDYVKACGADSQIALLGYSQGANVITDALAGSWLSPFPLSRKYHDNIKAVALFGDPSFTREQSFNAGSNDDRNGIFKRWGLSLRKLNTYADVIQDYCDEGDFFCATGGSLEVHSATVAKYAREAGEFVSSKAR